MIYNFSYLKWKKSEIQFFLYISKINPNSKAKTHDINGSIMNLFCQLKVESKIGKMAG